MKKIAAYLKTAWITAGIFALSAAPCMAGMDSSAAGGGPSQITADTKSEVQKPSADEHSGKNEPERNDCFVGTWSWIWDKCDKK